MATSINVISGDDNVAYIPKITRLPIYSESVEVMELPNFEGTRSMFNPYVIFSLHDVGSTGTGKYNYTKHYDMLPNGMSQDNGTGMTLLGDVSGGAVSINPFTSVMTSAQSAYSEEENQRLMNEQANAERAAIQAKQAQKFGLKDQSIAQRLVPTAENIIEYNRNVQKVFGYGPTPYSWSDFLYCKYYGKIPNNRMITLRRYPYPISDNVVVPNGNAVLPVAQAVTWFSEDTGNKLSDLLQMTYGVIWKEIEAEVQEVDGNEQPFGVGMESILGNKAVSGMGTLLTAARGSYDLWSGRAEKGVEWSKKAFTNSGPYWNQVYGPVNVVHKSHMRDRGLKFTNDITLKFHYSINSYGGVNPKVAMLDLISNFLVLTYTNAKFWGGAMRYFPNASFRTGFLGNQNAFYSGDYIGYARSVGDTIKDTLGFLNKAIEDLLKGNFGSITGILGKLIGGSLAEKSQPQQLSIRSLLSGEPVGEWHLTVGNPLNPIAVIGNLILDETTIKFGDTLGIDDFPTEVEFEVKLKHGKPRDKGDIESLFNNGYGRMTYAQLNALPSEMNTFKTSAGTAAQGNDGEEARQMTPEEIQNMYDYLNTGEGSRDLMVQRVKSRVNEIWGNTFSESANLLFLINSSKGRF
jgi:hypothetical protein